MKKGSSKKGKTEGKKEFKKLLLFYLTINSPVNFDSVILYSYDMWVKYRIMKWQQLNCKTSELWYLFYFFIAYSKLGVRLLAKHLSQIL